MKLSIFECQPGLFCRPTEDSTQEGYRFAGRREGGYEFTTREGKRELFARRKSFSGWHLKRGAYVYEFAKCAITRREKWTTLKKLNSPT